MVRTFLYLAAMEALLALLWHWNGRPAAEMGLFATLGSFMSGWFVVVFRLTPDLSQLRLLRTLPVSATHLAAALITPVIAPLFALGLLVAGVVSSTVGLSPAIAALKSFIFILAPGALCVFVTVWRGVGMQAYALQLLILFGFLLAPLWLGRYFRYPEPPLSLAVAFAAFWILLAFLLTRRALLGSRQAYRPPGFQITNFGGLPWSASR